MKEITFNLEEDNELNFGQEVYFIEKEDKGVTFRETCPFCNNTRKIIYKGKEFDCPECSSSNSFRISHNLYLKQYFISSYIINKVIIEGPEVKSHYKNKDCLKGKISFQAFRKTQIRNSFSGPNVTIRNLNSHLLLNDAENLKKLENLKVGSTSYFFKNKKIAEKALQIFIEKDKAELNEFNKLHGTEYKYPFE